MRVQVTGNSASAVVLAGNLTKCGYVVTTDQPTYTVLVEDGDVKTIVVDSADAALCTTAACRIGELSPKGGVFLLIATGNKDDRKLVVTIPKGDAEEAYAVEIGVMRALDQVTKVPDTKSSPAVPQWLVNELGQVHSELAAVSAYLHRPRWWKFWRWFE